ncbi:unnamed protein product, partial [Mesorhabditis spiculigera]
MYPSPPTSEDQEERQPAWPEAHVNGRTIVFGVSAIYVFSPNHQTFAIPVAAISRVEVLNGETSIHLRPAAVDARMEGRALEM